jgi:hypothetical protein
MERDREYVEYSLRRRRSTTQERLVRSLDLYFRSQTLLDHLQWDSTPPASHAAASTSPQGNESPERQSPPARGGADSVSPTRAPWPSGAG